MKVYVFIEEFSAPGEVTESMVVDIFADLETAMRGAGPMKWHEAKLTDEVGLYEQPFKGRAWMADPERKLRRRGKYRDFIIREWEVIGSE